METYDISNPSSVLKIDETTTEMSSGFRKIYGLSYTGNSLIHSRGEFGLLCDSLSFPYARTKKDSTGFKFNAAGSFVKPVIVDSNYFSCGRRVIYKDPLNLSSDTFSYKRLNILEDLSIQKTASLGNKLLAITFGTEGYTLHLLDISLNILDTKDFQDTIIDIVSLGNDFYIYKGIGDEYGITYERVDLCSADSANEIVFIDSVPDFMFSYDGGNLLIENNFMIQSGDSLLLYDVSDVKNPVKRSSVFCHSKYDDGGYRVFDYKKNFVFNYYTDVNTFSCCSIFCFNIENPDSIKREWGISVLNNSKPDFGGITFVNDYLFLTLSGDRSRGCKNIVYDISDPFSPLFVDTMNIFPIGFGVGKGNYFYGMNYGCGYNRVKFGELKQELSTDAVHGFGSVPENSELSQLHSIINTGSADLTIDSIKGMDGFFSLETTIPIIISPKDTGYVNIKFSPDSTEIYEDTMYIYSNDVYAMYHKVQLTGEGSAFSAKEELLKINTILYKDNINILNSNIHYSSLYNTIIKFDIYDVCGRNVRTASVDVKKGFGNINLKNYVKKTGIYFLDVKMNKITMRKKILIF